MMSLYVLTFLLLEISLMSMSNIFALLLTTERGRKCVSYIYKSLQAQESVCFFTMVTSEF